MGVDCGVPTVLGDMPTGRDRGSGASPPGGAGLPVVQHRAGAFAEQAAPARARHRAVVV